MVLRDLLHIKRELSKIGLTINNSKSELICLNLEDPSQIIENLREILPDLKITSVEETIVLGSPITSHGIRIEIKSKLDALTRIVSKLEMIDPHQAFFLLKHSLAIPKLTYLLRSTPPTVKSTS